MFSKSLLDRTIPFGARIYGPVQVSVAIVAVVLLVRVLSSRVPFAAVCVVLAVVVLAWVWPWRIWLAGFSDVSTWDIVKGTPAAAAPGPFEEAVAGLPEGDLIVTNGPDRLYVQTGRSSILLPARKFPISEQSNPNFMKEVAEPGEYSPSTTGRCAYYGVDSGPNLPSLASSSGSSRSCRSTVSGRVDLAARGFPVVSVRLTAQGGRVAGVVVGALVRSSPARR